MKTRLYLAACFVLLLAFAFSEQAVYSQAPPRKGGLDARARSLEIEARELAHAYRGIFASGGPQRDLFPIRPTGVTTAPVVAAARNFLAALSPEQRAKTVFPVDNPEWRKWMNQHFYVRQGVSFAEMDEARREAAFGLLRASLSARGFDLARDIMRLNHTLGEMLSNFGEYGEWLYHLTVMGEPSETQPWGWQIDGHHLIVNYFVLGDQVAMTPTFVGSEPVVAESGKFQGVAILQEEQREGLAFLRSLPADLLQAAVLDVSKTGNNNLGEAFRDNFDLDYAGLRASRLDEAGKRRLLSLIERYIGIQAEGHARIKMDEIRARLDETYFAWIGGKSEDSVFYYRIHSPVVLIEFDHQNPAGLRSHYPSPPGPIRQHIHCVVRTPNGNDYGKDLLRQHYLRGHVQTPARAPRGS